MSYMNFKNICRTCLCTSELQSIEGNLVIIELLQIITDYEHDDNLPKEICNACVLKINEIRSFVLQCKTSDNTLKKYLIERETHTVHIKKEMPAVHKLHEELIISDDEPAHASFDEISGGSCSDDDGNCVEKQDKPVTYKCDTCFLEFTDLRKFTRHKKIHPNITNLEKPKKEKIKNEYKAYKCDACDMVYTSVEHLTQHKRVQHNKNAIHKCQICGKQFASLGSWIRHQVLHEKQHSFKCDICGKTFNFVYNLKVHRRVHTGSKPYKCTDCERRFSNATLLKRHKMLHTEEKPYFCDVCSKAFTEAGHLKQHKRTHSGEKPYFCQLCEKGFSFSNSLIRHNRTHTGDRPYKCKICLKKFTDSSNLSRHIKTHL